MSASKPSEASEDRVYHFSDRSLRRLLSDPWAVRDLVKIIEPKFVGSLDFSRGVQESRTFVSELLRQRESDVLLRVPFQETSESEEILICILVEHQSSVDSLMGLRVLTYMVEIWHRELREWESGVERRRRFSPILPIVLYTGEGRWSAPLSLAEVMDIPDAFVRFVPTFETLLLEVKASQRDTFTELGSLFGWLLSVLRETPDDKAGLRDALATAVLEINRSEEAHVSQIREAIRYLILLIIHQCSKEERTELIELVDRYSSDDMEVIGMAQTAAEALIEQGREQSREQYLQQGIEQGAKAATIESIVLFLDTRFEANTSETLRPTLEAIEDLQRLKRLLREAMQTPSLEAFTRRLTDPGNIL